MKTTKIVIKNLFGIREAALDGRSVELAGPKGSGKTSVLDAIRYALTNRSDRDYIIHQGADEGEIIIETDTGLSIDRKTRTTKADTVKVRDGSMLQTRPAEFLSGILYTKRSSYNGNAAYDKKAVRDPPIRAEPKEERRRC